MTVAEFRKDPQLPVMWAEALAKNELLKLVLFDVMEEAHPAKYAIAGDGNDDVSPTRAAIELGLTRGYSKFGDTLRLLAKPTQKITAMPEPSYEPAHTEEEEPENV
jgi:hypothetical protein